MSNGKESVALLVSPGRIFVEVNCGSKGGGKGFCQSEKTAIRKEGGSSGRQVAGMDEITERCDSVRQQ